MFTITSALRHSIIVLATASFLPLINSVGVLVIDAIVIGVDMDKLCVSLTCTAVHGWVCLYNVRHADSVDGRLLWINIRYGERMRAWIDMGYSVDVER